MLEFLPRLVTFGLNDGKGDTMMDENGRLLERITVNPKVLVGKPTIRGMRISVEQILNLLSRGMTVSEIIEEHPVLEEEDIRAALYYAYKMMSIERVYSVGK